MEKRNWLKKAKIRLLRKTSKNTRCDIDVSVIQSSLETINKQLESLTSLSQNMECVETFTKERLAVKSRDNLRIENLKKIFRLAYGNLKFASEALSNDNTSEMLASFHRRLSFMKNSIEKILNDEGVRPIIPSLNDEISESEHRIVQTIKAESPESLPGHIAECLEIGFAVQGVITPAEVMVFASIPEADNK